MVNEGAWFGLSVKPLLRRMGGSGGVRAAGRACRGGVGGGVSPGRIGSRVQSLTPNMGSIGELFMDGYIRFG